MQFTDDWSKAKDQDADLLMIGNIRKDLHGDRRSGALVDAAASWINTPVRQLALDTGRLSSSDRAVESTTAIGSRGPLATVIGFQSPFHDQRSVVTLLADGSPRAWQLLNDALIDNGKRGTIYGSAAIIRESGMNSLRVGDNYYVGHLPCWERLRAMLAMHPFWLALCVVVVVVLFALMTWRLMRIITRRWIGSAAGRGATVADLHRRIYQQI
nr:Cellulose synthase regulatory subunit [Candidatus Pantoea persica]